MSSLKKCLKQAKQYIEVNDPESALDSISDALEFDPDNYFAYVFQGKSYQLLNDFPKAAKSFHRATEIEPDNLLGWKGYFQLAKSGDDINLFFDTLTGLVSKQMEQELPVADTGKDAINYLQYHGYKNNDELYEKYLRSILPGTVLGDSQQFLSPQRALTDLVELTKRKEKASITSLLSKETMRLPRVLTSEHKARLNDLKWSVYKKSDLAKLMEQLINVTDDDEVRQKYESEFLEYKYDLLLSSPQKAKLQTEIKELVEGLIIVKHPSLLCWQLYFDWLDVKNLGEELDLNNIIFFLQNFQSLGLGMVIYAYVMSDISPFNKNEVVKRLKEVKAPPLASTSDKVGDVDSKNYNAASDLSDEMDADAALLNLEDNEPIGDPELNISPKQTLAILTEGFESCSSSVFASRIVCNYYIHLRAYEEGSLKCRDSIRLLADLQRSTGIDLVHTREDFLSSLAIIYTYYEAPKNFGKALQLYDRILADNKDNVKAIVGKGLILIEKNQLLPAKEILQEVVDKFPNNVSSQQALIELNWCNIRLGEYSKGRSGLLEALSNIKGTDVHSSETRAVIHWRISTSYEKEQNFEECFKHLIQSLKESKNFAPAYTSLGVLYEEQYQDKSRAQKCFYKAFELDVGEIRSARYLVADLTSNNEWEVAEVLCKRIVTTERSRRMLFNEDKDNLEDTDRSWPYRVLGCAALNRQEDDKAVEWFQTALRMTSMDVQCWIGLGEAYYNCGRLDASAKVLRHTVSLTTANGKDNSSTLWVVQYMLGVVLSEMGQFDSAILQLTASLELRDNNEECVIHALYESMINNATKLVLSGFIGRAIEMNSRAVELILKGVQINPKSQKLWKDLGDCIRIFNIIQDESNGALLKSKVIEIINSVEEDLSNGFMEELKEIDEFERESVQSIDNYTKFVSILNILAAKNAIHVLPLKSNKLLRSMAYYNLGLAYLEAFKSCDQKSLREASIKSLKKSIQLENSNATYWVTLGNAFASSNPQISQHCFIKATALESRDADIWTNLAALYLRYGDHKLAEEAFLRALSVAPQQPQSWLGHALTVQAGGKQEEASRLFNHAYILANGRSSLAQLLYGLSIITKRLKTGVDPRDIQASQEFSVANFAMNNYLKFSPNDEVGLSVALIISERCKDYTKGIEIGNRLIDILEKKYEEDSESEATLISFARAKTQVARMYLGIGEYDKALENAEFGLNVIGEDDDDTVEESSSLVLSARITIGLAFFFSDQFDDALDQLKVILSKRPDSQRLVTLIAQILYAYSNEDTKQAAIDQLFNHIEEYGSTLLVVLTLGAISIVDDLDDYLGAIREELQGLSLNEVIGDSFRSVPQLISEINKRIDSKDAPDYTWQRNAVFFPQDYNVWKNVNTEMAFKVATLKETKLNAVDVSNAYVETGKLRAIQRGIIFDPMNSIAVEALNKCI